MNLLRRILAMLPPRIQEWLKRQRYRRQIRSGSFETSEPEFRLLDSLLSEGDWVVDVGANIGHYTTRMSALVGAAGRVIAFEPVPTTFRHLVENVGQCRFENVTLFNAAVSDHSTSVGMSIPNFDSGLKNYYEANISDRNSPAETHVLTLVLDSLDLNNKIRLIKMDAEGHEPQALAGAMRLISRDRPILVLETVTKTMRDKLTDLGYSEDKIDGSPNRVFSIEIIRRAGNNSSS